MSSIWPMFEIRAQKENHYVEFLDPKKLDDAIKEVIYLWGKEMN